MDNYRSFSVTEHGKKYQDKDMPCQDASTHAPDPERKSEIKNAVLAIVADGHGSTRCFRSHVGSEKAVAIADKQLKNRLNPSEAKEVNDIEYLTPPAGLEKYVGSHKDFKGELQVVIKNIINNWFVEVMEHEKENPLNEDPKLKAVEQKYQDRYTDNENPANIDYRCHAYGTTLMATVMTDKYWFAFQVGDGKCVVLYEDGTWSLPIPWDDNCTFNTTTSICDDNSLEKFRYWFGWKNDDGNYEEFGRGVEGQGKNADNKDAKRPLAIFIGTDGVEDSYPRVDNDKYVINFYRNRVLTLEKGFDEFDDEIKGFAERFAERESTDDVSIAGIVSDFNDKSEIISKMKNESAKHETSELLTIKKRDMEEKHDALALLKKQAGAKFSREKENIKQIEALGADITKLEKRKISLEMTFATAKAKAVESEKKLIELQVNRNEFEANYRELAEEKCVTGAKITVTENELLKAKKELAKKSNFLTGKQKLLKDKTIKYNSLIQKFTESDEMASNAISKDGVQRGIYNNKGQVKKECESFVIMVFDTIKAAISPDLLEQLESLDEQIRVLEQDIKSLQQQRDNANNMQARKHKELDGLRLELHDRQLQINQVQTNLKQVQQDHHTAECEKERYRNEVKTHEREIEEIEKQIAIKQAEVEKLKAELDVLKEQNKIQSDRIENLKTAYENAEQEVKELEERIK
jgi:serine/threonine protein phosphatase PrpC/multidrug efflux pump subunit AcrA (membrane-fusion protein)